MCRLKPSIVIFIFALILRLTIVAGSTEIPSLDAAGYDARANSILKDKIFGEVERPTAFKEPFYSFFLAGIYYVFGHNFLIVRTIQAILSAFTCVFLFLLARELFNESIGRLSGLIASLNPSFIKASEHLLTETLFTFILIVVVFYFLKVLKSPNSKSSFILGFLLGIGSLTRSVLAPFTILLCITLFFFLRKRLSLKIIMGNILVIFICFLTPIIPWTIRNWTVFHEFVPISTNVGINLYSSYFPPQGKLFGFTAVDENTKHASTLNSEPEQSRFLLYKTLERIKECTVAQIVKLEILKFLYFWVPIDWEIIGKGRYNIIYGFLLPFFIFGFVSLWNQFKKYIVIYLPIFYHLFMALITYASPRFRLPVEPYFILFSTAGFFILHEKYLLYRNFLYMLLTGWILTNVIGYIYIEAFKRLIKYVILY